MKKKKKIEYYGLFIGVIFLTQLLTNKIISNHKLSSIKFKFWILFLQ